MIQIVPEAAFMTVECFITWVMQFGDWWMLDLVDAAPPQPCHPDMFGIQQWDVHKLTMNLVICMKLVNILCLYYFLKIWY